MDKKDIEAKKGEASGEASWPGLHIAQPLVFYKNILLPQCLFHG